MDCYGFLWIPIDSYELLKITKDSYGLQWIPIDSYGLRLIA